MLLGLFGVGMKYRGKRKIVPKARNVVVLASCMNADAVYLGSQGFSPQDGWAETGRGPTEISQILASASACPGANAKLPIVIN